VLPTRSTTARNRSGSPEYSASTFEEALGGGVTKWIGDTEPGDSATGVAGDACPAGECGAETSPVSETRSGAA